MQDHAGRFGRVEIETDRVRGRLWPTDVAVRLGDLAPEGATISPDEDQRHEDLYSELLKLRIWGMSFIEGGFLYEKVRLCQLEPDTVDDCVVK